MARNGDELFNPGTGPRTVFRHTAEETNGELLQVDWNAGSDEVHALVDFRPGPRTEMAFETLAGLGRLLGYRPEYPYRLQPAPQPTGSHR
jgi:hypothetical protein